MTSKSAQSILIAQGRSHARGQVPDEELRELDALVRTTFSSHDDANWDVGNTFSADENSQGLAGDIVVIDGDLLIDSDLNLAALGLGGLIVRGNLVVHGLYADTDDHQYLVVFGDMEAGRVFTSADLMIQGSLRVQGALVGFYNDHGLETLGDLRAAHVVADEHSFKIGGKLEAAFTCGRWLHIKGEEIDATVPPERYGDVLIAEVLTIEEGAEPYFDSDTLRERLSEDLPIARPALK